MPKINVTLGRSAIFGLIVVAIVLGVVVTSKYYKPGPLLPDEPDKPIAGKTNEYNVPIGEIAVIDLSHIEGDNFAWIEHPAGTPFTIDSNGKIAYLASGTEGVYWLYLAIDGAEPFEQIRNKITVGSGIPPQRDPFGFDKVIPTLLDSVSVPNKNDTLLQFSFNYETTDALTIRELVRRVKEKNRSAMGSETNVEAWRPFWERLGKSFVTLGVKSLDDYRQAFKEIAKAFKKEAAR